MNFEEATHKISIHPPGASFEERKANALAIAEAIIPANDLANALQEEAALSVALGESSVCQ